MQQRTERFSRVQNGYLEHLTRRGFTLRLARRIAEPQEVHLSVEQFRRPSRAQSQNNLMNQLATSGAIRCSQTEYLYDRLIWRAQTCLLGIKKNPESEPRGCMIIALFTQGHSNPPCSRCDFLFQRHKNMVSVVHFMFFLEQWNMAYINIACINLYGNISTEPEPRQFSPWIKQINNTFLLRLLLPWRTSFLHLKQASVQHPQFRFFKNLFKKIWSHLRGHFLLLNPNISYKFCLLYQKILYHEQYLKKNVFIITVTKLFVSNN